MLLLHQLPTAGSIFSMYVKKKTIKTQNKLVYVWQQKALYQASNSFDILLQLNVLFLRVYKNVEDFMFESSIQREVIINF